MKNLLLYTFLLIALHSYAQVNLVPNGSFEQLSGCPTTYGQIELVKPWFNPNLLNSGLFNTCSVDDSSAAPANAFGYQTAQEGTGYAGVFLYWVKIAGPGPLDGNNSYIGVKLTAPLQADTYYCLDYYTTLPTGSAVSGVGAFFSADSIYQPNEDYIQQQPQIQDYYDMVDDTAIWQLQSNYLKAQGGEQYLYIGNFNDYSLCWEFCTFSYLFIDNVSLRQCDEVAAVDEVISSPITIYPNPASGSVTITLPNDAKNAQLLVYDISGRQVQQTQLNNLKQVDISNLSNGLYLFVVSSDKGILAREKIVVEN